MKVCGKSSWQAAANMTKMHPSTTTENVLKPAVHIQLLSPCQSFNHFCDAFRHTGCIYNLKQVQCRLLQSLVSLVFTDLC